MIAAARLDPVLHPRRPHALGLSVALHLCLLAAWVFAPSPVLHDLGAGALQIQLVMEPPPPEPLPPEPEQQTEPQPAKPQPQPLPVPKAASVKTAPTPKPLATRPAPVLTASAETTALHEAAPAAETVPAAAPAPAAPAGIPERSNAAHDEYLSVIWARIMAYRPPRVTLTGTAKLRFSLAADGELLSVEIAESSGSGLLDRAALNAVRRAAPFPPPPPSAAPVHDFVIPFQFRPTG